MYGGLDVYAHSSRFEGFSNSLLEAMAYSLPVVATNAGGNPEAVVEGQTGAVVSCGDANAFARCDYRLARRPWTAPTIRPGRPRTS